MLKVRSFWALLLFLGLYLFWGFNPGGREMAAVWAENELAVTSSEHPSDHQAGLSTTVENESGEVISILGREVSPGDEIITAEGQHYRITQVENGKAIAEDLGADQAMVSYMDFFASTSIPAMVQAEAQSKTVGIYHTHSDESYVPTDGTESIKFDGGIYQVGQTLAEDLEGENVQVEYDTTAHDPHDSNAYARSRRTAVQLMEKGPVALIDVHRDGIPDASYYQAQIENQDVARLRLVVGRENPNMNANLDFAKQMMAYANEVHPYVVKEIFLASGNYNQDLMPTALLVEAGTYTNSREEAERGI
ncbi:MAG: stage II sporulation protein P, partial [Clostridia bacterium]|nr:stage II sporulation protein P [Clostridia bacterium]